MSHDDHQVALAGVGNLEITQTDDQRTAVEQFASLRQALGPSGVWLRDSLPMQAAKRLKELLVLLFNIGLPKAGSSSLQAVLARAIHPRERILSPDPPLEGQADAMESPATLLLLHATGRHVRGFAESELTRLRRIVQSQSETLVVSIEYFTKPGFLSFDAKGERKISEVIPIETRIRNALEVLRAEPELTRLVCQIRRPDEWLASAFAWGMMYPKPTGYGIYSRTFDVFVCKWLKAEFGEDVLNFPWLDSMLSSIVGHDNVTFLALHTFGSEQYWKAFATGTTVNPTRLHQAFLGDVTRRNVQISEGGTYIPVRPRSLRGKLMDSLPRDEFAYRVLGSRWNLPVRALGLVSRPRPRPFKLEPEVSRQILQHYGLGNRTFSAERSLRLDGHRYWI